MDEQTQWLEQVARQELKDIRSVTPQARRHAALFRLMLGAGLGATTHTIYETTCFSRPLDVMALVTAVAAAIVILSFWKGLGHWLHDSVPWWAQLLVGFSVGLLGQTLSSNLVRGAL